MRYDTRKAAEAIRQGETFTTNGNLHGVKINDGLAVYSYAEPIAFFDFRKCRVHLNTRVYSNTTSRHQGYCKLAATQFLAESWEIDKWTAEQFQDVTQLTTKNRNPFYSWF